MCWKYADVKADSELALLGRKGKFCQMSICCCHFASVLFSPSLLVAVMMYFIVQVTVNLCAMVSIAGCEVDFDGSWVLVQLGIQAMWQMLATNLLAHRYLLAKVEKMCAFPFKWQLTVCICLHS